MKKRFSALLCCGVLAAVSVNLTGCMATDFYETEHFRFKVHDWWQLRGADYDEETKSGRYLSFLEGGDITFDIRETPHVLPLGENPDDDVTIREITGYKYPAWLTIWENNDNQSFSANNHACASLCILAEGHMLRINPSSYDNNWSRIEKEQLPVLLDSLELITEESMPQHKYSALETNELDISWSQDWTWYEPEFQFWDRTFTLCLSAPQNEAEMCTQLYLRELGRADRAYEREITNRLATDGTETDLIERTAYLLDDKSFCGMTFEEALRHEIQYKADGRTLVYRDYYFTRNNQLYAITLICDGTAEAHVNELLSGVTLTAKEEAAQ